jgi:RNA-directed DNA polymerase
MKRVTTVEQRAGRILDAERRKTVATLSNGGTPWSTKLDRIGRTSKEKEDVVFDNLGHVIDLYFLLDCFHQLDGKKAVGTDGVTKEIYASDLAVNLEELLIRIRRGTYTPRPARVVEIPKEDGSKRPLVISCFEDKIVQLAARRVLEAIYEPRFLPSSYGYRPGRSAHDAIRALCDAQYRTWDGTAVDVDLKKYFNSVPHAPLLGFLSRRIRDKRFLGLVVKLMTAPILSETGAVEASTLGVPQGSILSPVLSNIYLHHVLDEWFEHHRGKTFRGESTMVRYADDMVFVFRYKEEGERFLPALMRRFAKYGLSLNLEKSSCQPCGSGVVDRLHREGKPMPLFHFLGFKVKWTLSKRGAYRPCLKPRLDRTQSVLARIRVHLWSNLNHPNHMAVLRKVAAVVRGWVNYFRVSDCVPFVRVFVRSARIMIHRWFNRRGSRGCMNWQRLSKILKAAGVDERVKVISLFGSSKRATIQSSGA